MKRNEYKWAIICSYDGNMFFLDEIGRNGSNVQQIHLTIRVEGYDQTISGGIGT